MKYYDDFSDSSFLFGNQPHKFKHMNKGKKLHSSKREEAIDDFGKHRASYKRAETKNMMRNQLRDSQMAF